MRLGSITRRHTSTALRAAARSLSYRFSNYRASHVRHVDLELTNRCNLHCGMCWFHGANGIGDRYRAHELTTDEVVGVIDQLSAHGPFLYLGGGEPFLRPDCLRILEHIKNARRLRVALTTNGTLLSRDAADALVDLAVDVINVSIDGPEDLHDGVRGNGVFKRATEAIVELSVRRRKTQSRAPVIYVNITVSAALAGRLREAVDAIRQATDDGVDVYRIHHLWYITPAELDRHRNVVHGELGCLASAAASHLLPQSHLPDPAALADEIETVRRLPDVQAFPDLAHAEILDYYSPGNRRERRCTAPFSQAVIRPNGDVLFCPDDWIDGYVLGNVRTTPFDRIWNNSRARAFRRVLWKRECFPACKRCSWMYSS